MGAGGGVVTSSENDTMDSCESGNNETWEANGSASILSEDCEGEICSDIKGGGVLARPGSTEEAGGSTDEARGATDEAGGSTDEADEVGGTTAETGWGEEPGPGVGGTGAGGLGGARLGAGERRGTGQRTRGLGSSTPCILTIPCEVVRLTAESAPVLIGALGSFLGTSADRALEGLTNVPDPTRITLDIALERDVVFERYTNNPGTGGNLLKASKTLIGDLTNYCAKKGQAPDRCYSRQLQAVDNAHTP